MIDSNILATLYDYMQTYSDKKGVDLTMHYGMGNIVRISSVDNLTFITYNAYYTEHMVNSMETYIEFEKAMDFLDTQERLRREDVKSQLRGGTNVFQNQEPESGSDVPTCTPEV